uniref:Uncharacterized protein n=1 Tax=Kalanchoe fedtschenkoi TaxID=63787 RepID=A0A7N0UFX4_KALFE
MFRQAASRLALRSAKARSFSTDLSAAPSGDAASFIEGWKKVVPNIEPPKTPSAFMQPRPATPTAVPSKLTVNFVLPYASELSGKEVRKSFDLILPFGFWGSDLGFDGWVLEFTWWVWSHFI